MITWPDGSIRSQNNAFAILLEPRKAANTATAPKKRGPRPTHAQEVIASLRTDAERAELRILRVNRNTHTPSTQGDKDRNAVIAGRGVHLGRNL